MSSARFRPLQRPELDTLLGWAANEGWNPGSGDADAFWAADPEAFLGIEMKGNLIGGGSIVSYAGEAGFMGLFIVQPEWRNQGLGRKFWYHRRDLLLSRLQPGAPICMDGVFAMQSFYSEGGFVFTHRNLRMEGVGRAASPAPEIIGLEELPFADLETFDLRYFLWPRRNFLEKWIHPTGGRALGFVSSGQLRGYGVLRRCRTGFKIGPLFAETPAIANSLFIALSSHASSQPLFLDIPENNPDALALASNQGMKEVFGCARMVLGPVPPLPWATIYGVSTFELG